MLGAIAAAQAAGCPGNPGAMGTSRVLKIDPREFPRIGTVQYQDTLPLNDKEVVLTFDDGPMPPYTTRVLETLAHECVKANYFIVGRMARGYPDLLRRIAAEGHVIGTHSENHPLAFEKMPLRAVQQEIDQGFTSTAAALAGQGTVAPFFRIPGLLRAEHVEGYLRSRGMVTWSADVVADDWKHITASEVVSRTVSRLDARGKGIVLLHDIQPATALALPHLLRELKRRGYKIVQVAPESAADLIARAPVRPPQTVAVQAQPMPAQPTPSQPVQAPLVQRNSIAMPFPTTSPSPTVARPVPSTVTTTVTRIVPPIQQPEPAVSQALEPGASAQTSTRGPNQAPVQLPAVDVPAVAAAAEPEPPPLPSRAMPVPILDAPQPAPARNNAPPEQRPAAPAQAARPLTPGFKPSHSEALPTKVAKLPIEEAPKDPVPPPSQANPAQPEPEQRELGEAEPEQPTAPARRIDSWSWRAQLAPAPRSTPWPVAASSLTQATPR